MPEYKAPETGPVAGTVIGSKPVGAVNNALLTLTNPAAMAAALQVIL